MSDEYKMIQVEKSENPTVLINQIKYEAEDLSDVNLGNEMQKFEGIKENLKTELEETISIKENFNSADFMNNNSIKESIENEKQEECMKPKSASLEDIDDFRAFKREEPSGIKKRKCVCVWEDDWDDPGLEDDFSLQLRDELLATWKTFTNASD